MAFTFDPAISTPRDQLRLLIGDTDSNVPEFQDETISYLLSIKTINQAAIYCIDSMIAKYSRYSSERVGSVSVDYGTIIDGLIKLKKQFQTSNNVFSAIPFAGGISISDKDSNNSDSDLVKPEFTKDLHNNNNDVDAED